MWRICERFPNWLQTPDRFYLLPPEQQAQAIAYELIREAEETELAIAGSAGAM